MTRTASTRSRVEDFFRANPTEWSRYDIAEKLDISVLTATRYIRALVDEGIIMDTGRYERRIMYMLRD